MSSSGSARMASAWASARSSWPAHRRAVAASPRSPQPLDRVGDEGQTGLELLAGLDAAALQEQREADAPVQQRRRGTVVGDGERRPTLDDRLPQPAGPGQRLQLAAAEVDGHGPVVGELEGAVVEGEGAGRVAGGGLLGPAHDPGDGLGVALRRPEGELGRHPLQVGRGAGEGGGGVAVHGGPRRRRDALVERLADEVVAEADGVAVIVDQLDVDGAPQGLDQVDDAAAADRRQLRDRAAHAEHRSVAQQLGDLDVDLGDPSQQGLADASRRSGSCTSAVPWNTVSPPSDCNERSSSPT